MRPRLILLDEPVSALRRARPRRPVADARGLREELGTALVIVSHDLESLATVADRIVSLRQGAVVESESVSVLR